jgi:type VI secretion system secreted protein VgrG
MGLTQTNRLFIFDSPLGQTLLCNKFSGEECVSGLFKFQLELASEEFGISWDQLVGKNVTVGIRHLDGISFRYFNGYISKFAPLRHAGRLAYYTAEMVPWLWFLTLTQDCLIYQHKTVPDVLTTTFNKYGYQDYQLKLTDSGDRHKPWEYCCQYRETGFEFVSRLMEIEGIYYYFMHEMGKHTLIMVDGLTAHTPCPYQSTFNYDHNLGAGLFRTADTISDTDMHKAMKPSVYAHKEFNFKKPEALLEFHSTLEDASSSVQSLQVYDYPGEFEEVPEGRDWSKVRQEEQECDRVISHGSGNGRAMVPGYRFTLLQCDRTEQNIDYLILSVKHDAQEGTLLPGTDAQDASYSNSWSAMPWEVQYRPKRKTDKAQMLGAQTAWVVGPKGEEIYTDEFGRIKVQFHWDRKGQYDANSSCWIRIMQPLAGPGFGHIWIPRVGQEVIVDFLEGDPDRPIVTGCVYNQKNMPPYTLPDKKNWSGIKTRSTLGGTASNYNELRFIDTSGSELYVLHAEKDMEITVNNDTNEIVGDNRTLQVTQDQIELVKGDKHNTVQGELREEVGSNMSLNVGGTVNEKAAQNFVLEAGGDIHLKAGGRIVLEAAQGVFFLGTGGFINVTDQVVIQGSQVLVNCGIPSPPGALSAQPSTPQQPTYSPSPDGSNSSTGSAGVQSSQSASSTSMGSTAESAASSASSTNAGGSSSAGSSAGSLASNPYFSGFATDSGTDDDGADSGTDDDPTPPPETGGEPDVFS